MPSLDLRLAGAVRHDKGSLYGGRVVERAADIDYLNFIGADNSDGVLDHDSQLRDTTIEGGVTDRRFQRNPAVLGFTGDRDKEHDERVEHQVLRLRLRHWYEMRAIGPMKMKAIRRFMAF